MEKDRGTRIIAIIALLIGAISLTVGFSAFSNSLYIKPALEVQPDPSKFKVNFSSEKDSLTAGTVSAVVKTAADASAENATIDNETVPTISNLKAVFKEPGDSVTYTFYASNVGAYKAYLTGITFKNAPEVEEFKKCTANVGTTESYVESACNDIKVTVIINGKTTDGVTVGGETYTGSVAGIKSHPLAIKEAEEVTVKIEYQNTGDYQQRADGDFKVEFGDISLTYSSVDTGGN